MRHILTYPGAHRDDPEGHAMLKAHRSLVGVYPTQTDEQKAHAAQTVGRKVGWNGAGPINEWTCAECGIMWVTG